jgi:hypothetical protein
MVGIACLVPACRRAGADRPTLQLLRDIRDIRNITEIISTQYYRVFEESPDNIFRKASWNQKA